MVQEAKRQGECVCAREIERYREIERDRERERENHSMMPASLSSTAFFGSLE